MLHRYIPDIQPFLSPQRGGNEDNVREFAIKVLLFTFCLFQAFAVFSYLHHVSSVLSEKKIVPLPVGRGTKRGYTKYVRGKEWHYGRNGARCFDAGIHWAFEKPSSLDQIRKDADG